MTDTLMVVAWLAPWLLVWVVAGVIAAVRWTKHPVVSALVVVAACTHVLTAVSRTALPYTMRERLDVAQTGMLFTAIGLVGLAGTICFVAAVFVGRQDAPAR